MPNNGRRSQLRQLSLLPEDPQAVCDDWRYSCANATNA